MDRRSFLRLLSSGTVGAIVGAELDIEKLLWVPKPMITIPAMRMGPAITLEQIIDAELTRLGPMLQTLFDRDDHFYKVLEKMESNAEIVSNRTIRVPFTKG